MFFVVVFSELMVVKIDYVSVLETRPETLFELDLQYLFWLAV